MATIYLGTPTTRGFDAGYVRSLHCTDFGPGDTVIWDAVTGQAIDVGRNAIVERFLAHPLAPTHLLMHDSDATWHPQAVRRLLEHDLPCVSAVIFGRRLPPLPTGGPYEGLTEDGHHAYHFGKLAQAIAARAREAGLDEHTANEVVLPKGGDPSLFAVDGMGAHFMLIRRDVLEALEPPYYLCTTPNAGEDFYFCRKVRAAGFPIYVDLDVYTGHNAGPGFDLGLREFLAFSKFTRQEAEGAWKV